MGAFAGDKLAAASAELRVPFGSVLSIGSIGANIFGANIFFDVGSVFEAGRSLRTAQFRHGAGAGVFVYAPLFRFQLEVAHNLVSDVRIHIGAALTF